MHKCALTLILPVFMAVSFGLVASGCDDKADKKDEKKAEDKKEEKKVDEKKEEKADGGW
jgi:ribosomal protein L12E/L44/L45/RPP1/RPP2